VFRSPPRSPSSGSVSLAFFCFAALATYDLEMTALALRYGSDSAIKDAVALSALSLSRKSRHTVVLA
jgi:hypothetical protein